MRKHKSKQNESDKVDLEESQQDISLESKKIVQYAVKITHQTI